MAAKTTILVIAPKIAPPTTPTVKSQVLPTSQPLPAPTPVPKNAPTNAQMSIFKGILFRKTKMVMRLKSPPKEVKNDSLTTKPNMSIELPANISK